MPSSQINTPTCIGCGRSSTLTVSETGIAKWRGGALIQDALPELDADQRELLVSGIHPECWAKMFGDEDADDEAMI